MVLINVTEKKNLISPNFIWTKQGLSKFFWPSLSLKVLFRINQYRLFFVKLAQWYLRNSKNWPTHFPTGLRFLRNFTLMTSGLYFWYTFVMIHVWSIKSMFFLRTTFKQLSHVRICIVGKKLTIENKFISRSCDQMGDSIRIFVVLFKWNFSWKYLVNKTFVLKTLILNISKKCVNFYIIIFSRIVIIYISLFVGDEVFQKSQADFSRVMSY